MKTLLLRFLASAISFVISLALTWATAHIFDRSASKEPEAVKHLRAIGKARLAYSRDRGEFADRRTLGKAGLIDAELATGKKDGYVFSTQAMSSTKTTPAMFDVTASPQGFSFCKTGEHAFYSNATFVLYRRKGSEPPVALSSDRVPKHGEPFSP